MSNIGGKKREQQSFDNTKFVGLFEANVIAVNPDAEEFKDILGIELKEDSKATEYLNTSQDGNKTLRVDFWLEEVKDKNKFKVSFYLENKEKVNKDGNKKQYINAVGTTSWADDENNLLSWFKAREYRVAYVGESNLYEFLRTWLGNLDYRDAETTLQLDWNKLMKGNVKDLKDQVNGEWCTTVVCLATVKTTIKEEETKEYQSVYNGGFLPAYSLKHFRNINYNSDSVISGLRTKKSKDLKPHERFVLNVSGEYGCKDYYVFKDLKVYNADDNLVASNETLSDDGGDF